MTMAPRPISQLTTCRLATSDEILGFAVRPRQPVAADSIIEWESVISVFRDLRPLVGAGRRAEFFLGVAVDGPVAGPGLPPLFTSEYDTLRAPVWDSWSSSLYFKYHSAVLRLVGSEARHVAGRIRGQVRPGEAQFEDTRGLLVSDGFGSLYCSNRAEIYRIQLPESWRAGDSSQRTPAGGGEADEAAAADGGAVTNMLQFTAPDHICGMVFVPPHLAAVLQAGGGGAGQQGGSGQGRRAANQGCLVFCTPLAVYRLPLPATGPSSRAHHAQRRQPPQPQLQAQLLAGVEWARGRTDGPPTVARFSNIRGLAVDAEANLYVTDECDDDTDCVRRVSFADGTVTTLVTELPGPFWWPTVLPNGYLAVSSHEDGLLIDLGLQPLLPPWPPVVEAAAGPPPRSLTADLGALLEDAQQPGGGLMSDLVVRVGERRFPCHRLILAARCDYFKHRLLAPDAGGGGGGGDSGGGSGSGCGSSCGGFVDAREAEVELPDADADAFALLLRWLYTGAVDIPPQQARALAVLADRLLLPDLCAAAQAVVASSVSACTAVDCLLWAAGAAEARGGADGCFGWLLEELQGWYVEHHEEVKAEADESRERLAIEAPLLALRLADAVLERVGGERSAAAADRKRRRA